MTWSDYFVHGRNISKLLQMSWNHFRNFLTPKNALLSGANSPHLNSLERFRRTMSATVCTKCGGFNLNKSIGCLRLINPTIINQNHPTWPTPTPPLHPTPPSNLKPNSTARSDRFSSGTPSVTVWNSLCSIPVTWVSTHNYYSVLILECETVYPRKTRKKFAKKKDLVIMIKPGTYVG